MPPNIIKIKVRTVNNFVTRIKKASTECRSRKESGGVMKVLYRKTLPLAIFLELNKSHAHSLLITHYTAHERVGERGRV
jgi:hypothetical protein